MLELFAYPVSVVMKAWHLLFSEVFHLGLSAAWILSVIGLVITVRGLLLPAAWVAKRSAHRSVLMRPEKAELQRLYGDSADPEDITALRDGTRALNEKYGFSPAAGCIPPLIQIPIVLGLYRLLLWISRPELLGEHRNASGGVGALSGEDVVSFEQARLFDVPLPAFIAMSDERLAELGTNAADTWAAIFPFVVVAVVFTTANLVVTSYYNYKYMNWASKAMRVVARILVVFAVVMPFFIFWLGTRGPLPFALVLYWVTGNLWTALQTVFLNVVIRRRWPEGEEHRELRRRDRQELIDARRARRTRQANDRAFVSSAKSRGSTRAAARAELKERDRQEAKEKMEEKASKKALRRERNKAERELRAQQIREKRERKKSGES